MPFLWHAGQRARRTQRRAVRRVRKPPLRRVWDVAARTRGWSGAFWTPPAAVPAARARVKRKGGISVKNKTKQTNQSI